MKTTAIERLLGSKELLATMGEPEEGALVVEARQELKALLEAARPKTLTPERLEMRLKHVGRVCGPAAESELRDHLNGIQRQDDLEQLRQWVPSRLHPEWPKKRAETLAVLGLGLAEKSGELVSGLKHWLGHGHEFRPERLAGKVPEVLFYLFGIATVAGLDVSKAIRQLQSRVTARYPNGYEMEGIHSPWFPLAARVGPCSACNGFGGDGPTWPDSNRPCHVCGLSASA